MKYEQVATLRFSAFDESVGIVRAASNAVALAISSKADGDAEIFLNLKEVEELIAALRAAIATAAGEKA